MRSSPPGGLQRTICSSPLNFREGAASHLRNFFSSSVSLLKVCVAFCLTHIHQVQVQHMFSTSIPEIQRPSCVFPMVVSLAVAQSFVHPTDNLKNPSCMQVTTCGSGVTQVTAISWNHGGKLPHLQDSISVYHVGLKTSWWYQRPKLHNTRCNHGMTSMIAQGMTLRLRHTCPGRSCSWLTFAFS